MGVATYRDSIRTHFKSASGARQQLGSCVLLNLQLRFCAFPRRCSVPCKIFTLTLLQADRRLTAGTNNGASKARQLVQVRAVITLSVSRSSERHS